MKGRKDFFFEKKKKKVLIMRPRPGRMERSSIHKGFLVLFFQKRTALYRSPWIMPRVAW
jgi:hypothetical protein